jgi:23S rRNA pseudouridine2605 synthase
MFGDVVPVSHRLSVTVLSDLKRVSFGDIELNNLPTNKTRYYTRREYSDLYSYIKSESKKEERAKEKIKREKDKR